MSASPQSIPRDHLGSDGAKPAREESIAALAVAPLHEGAQGSLIGRIRRSPAGQNFGWLAVDRGVRLVVGLLVGSWVARYLGQAGFGLLSYALAFVGIFSALAPLGMDALAVREIIRAPEQGGRWIGTVIGFRALAALVFALLGCALIVVLRPHDVQAWSLVALLSMGAIFQALDSGELWFQAKTQMRRLVMPRLLLMLGMNALKIYAILRGAGVIWFAAFTALEQVIGGALTWLFVRRSLGADNRPFFETARGYALLRECWPLAVSALAVVLYMKLSQLVVGQLLGDASLAIYAAAIRIPEAALFLPVILSSSLLPSLLRSRAQGVHAYRVARLRFLRMHALLALAICVPVCLGAPWIIHFLYGDAYRDAAPVMAVYTWSLLFVFLGVARAQHLLNERQTHLPLWYSVLGLLVALVGCFVLIPRWGPMGAAAATVIAQLVSAFLSSFIHPTTHEIGREQWRALLTPWRIHAGARSISNS